MGSPVTPPLSFTPPPVSSYQGDFTPPPASSYQGDFTPPPLESLQGQEPSPFRKFLAEYGSQINPITAAQGVVGMAKDPKAAAGGYLQQQQSLLDRAEQAWNQGDHVGAAAHALYYLLNGVPGVGAVLDSAGNKFRQGDAAGGLADTAGLATNLFALEKLPAAPEAIRAGINKIRGLNEADPAVGMARVLKPRPGSSQSRFPETIKPAMEDIKEHGAGGGSITSNDAEIAAAEAAKDAARGAFEQWKAQKRPFGAFIDGSPIIEATRSAIPKTMWRGNPTGANAIMQEAQDIYGGRHTVDDLDDYLQQKNGEMAAFHDQSIPKQGAVLQSGGSKAILDAQADAIRDALYGALDPENGGAGPREVQQRFGAIKDVYKDALSRRVDALKEKPLTTLGALGKTGAALASLPGKLVEGELEQGLTNVAKPFRGTIDPLVKKSYDAIGRGRPFPLPEQGPTYPLNGITQGDIVPPAPPDSSYVRAAGLTPEQQVNGMRPALPAGKAPFTQGIVVPDIAGRPGPMTGRMVEAGPQPPVGGPREMPLPDTSGPVQRPVYQHPGGVTLPKGVIPPVRRLAPGEIRMPPTQIDIGSPAGDITDMIPIKDPTTGRINWVPRPPKLTGQAKGGPAKSDEALRKIERRAYGREATLRALRS